MRWCLIYNCYLLTEIVGEEHLRNDLYECWARAKLSVNIIHTRKLLEVQDW